MVPNVKLHHAAFVRPLPPTYTPRNNFRTFCCSIRFPVSMLYTHPALRATLTPEVAAHAKLRLLCRRTHRSHPIATIRIDGLCARSGPSSLPIRRTLYPYLDSPQSTCTTSFVMGWGMAAELREDLLRPAETIVDKPLVSADIVAVDGNAMLRNLAIGTVPASTVAQRLVARLYNPSTPPLDVLVCFDCPATMVALRAEVATKRAKRVLCAASLAQVAGIGEKQMPCTWELLFASPTGKPAAMRILICALKRAFVMAAKPSGPTPTVTMALPDGTRWVYPFGASGRFTAALAAQPYGEAEAQLVVGIRAVAYAAAAARAPVPRTVVHTIDTDILLQLLGIWSRNVQVVMAKVWRSKQGSIHRSKKAALPAPAPAWRVYSLDAMRDIFGGSALRVANAQFWLLCAGGVDYCAGIGAFGWWQRTCVELATRSLVCRADGGSILLMLRPFAAALLGQRNGVRKDGDVDAFVNELCRLVFCARYYLWPQNSTGPDFDPAVVPRGTATTVAGWLAAAPDHSVVLASAVVPLRGGAADDAQSLRSYALYTGPEAPR